MDDKSPAALVERAKANMEAINSIKLQLRLIENQIGREYGVAGKGDI